MRCNICWHIDGKPSGHGGDPRTRQRSFGGAARVRTDLRYRALPASRRETISARRRRRLGDRSGGKSPLRYPKNAPHRSHKSSQSNKRAYARISFARSRRHRAQRRRICAGRRSLSRCGLRGNAAHVVSSRAAFRCDQQLTPKTVSAVFDAAGFWRSPIWAWKMCRLNDLYSATPVHPGELLSVVAFEHLDLLRERARRIVGGRSQLASRFSKATIKPFCRFDAMGHHIIPRLLSGNTDAFLERLRTEFDTSVVPGRFFETPDHFRIGMGVNTEMFAEGLDRIGRALR